jgi:apolipoprotein N-acyltransferase
MNKEKLISFLRRLIVSQWRVVALASGLAVSLLSFVPNIFIQSTVLVIFVPFFLSVMKLPKKQAYTAGLIFFAAWILPTTYWYYGFMPWWLAVLASVGYQTVARYCQQD